jgi:hypothetical protein
MIKSKLSKVRTIFILVIEAFDFFWEEGFKGETFLLFEGSTSYLGGVTLLGFISASTSSSPPQSGDTEGVFPKVLIKFWTSLVLFCLLVPGVVWSL